VWARGSPRQCGSWAGNAIGADAGKCLSQGPGDDHLARPGWPTHRCLQVMVTERGGVIGGFRGNVALHNILLDVPMAPSYICDCAVQQIAG
jgi:hypothetical protein